MATIGHFIASIPHLKQSVLVEECELKPGCLLLLLWGKTVCQRAGECDGTLRSRTTYRPPSPVFDLERSTQPGTLKYQNRSCDSLYLHRKIYKTEEFANSLVNSRSVS